MKGHQLNISETFLHLLKGEALVYFLKSLLADIFIPPPFLSLSLSLRLNLSFSLSLCNANTHTHITLTYSNLPKINILINANLYIRSYVPFRKYSVSIRYSTEQQHEGTFHLCSKKNVIFAQRNKLNYL